MMKRLVAAMVLGAVAVPAHAEWFVEGFAGRSFPQNTDLRLTADQARVNGVVVPAQLRVDLFEVKPSNSTIYGARIGHWFGRTLGLAVDVSTLNPDVKRQTLTGTANLRFDETVFGEAVVIDPGQNASVAIPRIGVPTTATAAVLAMVRVPLGTTPDRPNGRFAPYAFAGPAYLVTDTSIDGKIGLRAGAGLRIALTRGLGVFGEYRYTAVDNAEAVAGRIGGSVAGQTGDTGDIRVRLDLRNHSAVGGLSLGF